MAGEQLGQVPRHGKLVPVAHGFLEQEACQT